ncbi:hypothetical protein HY004_01595 [Candidatus Saccharibacteria bacterium]|nr:hypothetical protein [Candidatus Saccharibacteria bacterium]
MERTRLIVFACIILVICLFVAVAMIDGHLKKAPEDQQMPLKKQLPAALLTIVALGFLVNWSGLI